MISKQKCHGMRKSGNRRGTISLNYCILNVIFICLKPDFQSKKKMETSNFNKTDYKNKLLFELDKIMRSSMLCSKLNRFFFNKQVCLEQITYISRLLQIYRAFKIEKDTPSDGC